MQLAYEAMMFAREVHKVQRRKYTNNPYADHLAEVADWDGRLDALDAAEQAILAVEPAAPPDRRTSPLWDGTP
jgi:(p)ppGpp synthase/HD superfamily hydrolase